MLDIETGKIKDFVKFGVGNLVMVTGGRNNGRVGTITHQEKHKGSFEIIHIKDAAGASSFLHRKSCCTAALTCLDLLSYCGCITPSCAVVTCIVWGCC